MNKLDEIQMKDNENNNLRPAAPGGQDAGYFALGGLAFLGLALFFLWRDLALPPEVILVTLTVVAAVGAALGQPRFAPGLAPGALIAAALIGGGWFALIPQPALLLALAGTLVGSVGAVLAAERRATPTNLRAADPRLAWYAAGASFLVATRSFYFWFLTNGVAADSPARRLILTIAWLAVGLALFVADRRRRSAALHVGVGLLAAAMIKAVGYDIAHLQGGLRVLMLAAVGALLLAGARVLRGRPAKPTTVTTEVR